MLPNCVMATDDIVFYFFFQKKEVLLAVKMEECVLFVCLFVGVRLIWMNLRFM